VNAAGQKNVFSGIMFCPCLAVSHLCLSSFCQWCKKTIHHKIKVFTTGKSLAMWIQWVTQRGLLKDIFLLMYYIPFSCFYFLFFH